jgi:hypothetical protein
MEIGEKALNPTEFVGRIYVGGRGAGMWAQMGGGFQNPDGRGAHGNRAAGGSDLLLQSGPDLIFFPVHLVIAKVSGFDWAKGAEADMKSHKGMLNLREKFGGKMEAGGGGGHGSGDLSGRRQGRQSRNPDDRGLSGFLEYTEEGEGDQKREAEKFPPTIGSEVGHREGSFQPEGRG